MLLLLSGFFMAVGAANDGHGTDGTPEEHLRAFLRLLTGEHAQPERYGFSSIDEAGRAKLGKSYGVWWIEAWRDHVKNNGGVGSSDPSLAEDVIYEVLGDDGGVKCVMAFALKDGKHQPMSLSIKSADVLGILKTMPDRDSVVLVIDEEGMKWVDIRAPLAFNSFPNGIGALVNGPRAGFIP